MKQVLHYPGSKWRIAKWIISHMPEHHVYVEPYFGSGAVFFMKKPSPMELINDIDGQVVNLFRTIRERGEELAELIEMTPWARDEYYACQQLTGDPLEDARRFLTMCWQAHGGSAIYSAGWRIDRSGHRGQNCAKQWRGMPERILEIVDRLRDAHIENRPAVDVIRNYNNPEALIYADPPYLLSTRNYQKRYRHEMDVADHEELLDTLNQHPGPVLLSGYDSDLYNQYLSHWDRREIDAVTESLKIRTEILWLNQEACRRLRKATGKLFEEVE